VWGSEAVNESVILALLDDQLALRKLNTAGDIIGAEVVNIEDPELWSAEDAPSVVVISVGAPDWEDTIEECRRRWPTAMMVCLLTVPDADLWALAEDSGCDLVSTRGAIHKVLPSRLERWLDSPNDRRVRLFSLADIAGRLGVVMRLDDEVAGPIAVYHIGKEVVAVQDLCPHAGAMLSNGDVSVDDGVVTCPEHGSRFDTKTGERLRGPADFGLRTFPVVVEDGQAYLEIGAA
jgi:nitrite reductase/ring-hydroxylating ferredoxin subunit